MYKYESMSLFTYKNTWEIKICLNTVPKKLIRIDLQQNIYVYATKVG